MPYIMQEIREKMRAGRTPLNAGELNYALTMLCKEYLREKYESYQTYDEIIGALECCKLEMYRRKVAPYEDKKAKSNGDVF